MLSVTQLTHSVRYALKGLRYVVTHEQNFRIQLLVALLVVVAMILFRVSGREAALLVAVMMSVLVLEVVNSIFEKFVDLLKPRIHYAVAEIKNMMAGAVFLASAGAAIIGLIIFWPYVFG